MEAAVGFAALAMVFAPPAQGGEAPTDNTEAPKRTCPELDRDYLVDSAEEAALDFELDEFSGYLAELETAYGCGQVTNTTELSRVLFAQAHRLYADEARRTESRLPVGVALSLGVAFPDDTYNRKILQFYLEKPTTETVEIRVENLPAKWTLWVDGRPPSETYPTGSHLVQVGPSSDAVRWATWTAINPDGVTVDVPRSVRRVDPNAPVVVVNGIRPTRVAAIGTGVAGLGALALGYVGYQSGIQAREAAQEVDYRRARTLNYAGGISGITLEVTTVVLMALPDRRKIDAQPP